MELICTSLGCTHEKPVEYCKECSHANWIIDKYLKFNPRFGFNSEERINWDMAEVWLDKLKNIDINETSFTQED